MSPYRSAQRGRSSGPCPPLPADNTRYQRTASLLTVHWYFSANTMRSNATHPVPPRMWFIYILVLLAGCCNASHVLTTHPYANDVLAVADVSNFPSAAPVLQCTTGDHFGQPRHTEVHRNIQIHLVHRHSCSITHRDAPTGELHNFNHLGTCPPVSTGQPLSRCPPNTGDQDVSPGQPPSGSPPSARGRGAPSISPMWHNTMGILHTDVLNYRAPYQQQPGVVSATSDMRHSKHWICTSFYM